MAAIRPPVAACIPETERKSAEIDVPEAVPERPEAAAAGPSSPLVGRVAAMQRPQGEIAELEKEPDFTPLKLCFLANRDFLLDPQKTPRQRLQCVSSWMQILHAQITGRNDGSHEELILSLRQLRTLQEGIVNHNLKIVGRLWGRSCCGFVSADRVRGWLRRHPDEFRAQLNSRDFCAEIGARCTFIPPEIAQILPDESWSAMIQGALATQKEDCLKTSNMALFQEIATWKNQSMDGETVIQWFTTFAQHFQPVCEPSLLCFLSFFKQRPTDFLSPVQWELVGKTVLALDCPWELPMGYQLKPISGRRAEAVAGLFLRHKEAFYPHWGIFAEQACELYSRSGIHEKQAYFSQLIGIFFSEPDQISSQQLIRCLSTLIRSSKVGDESLFPLCISIFERKPLGFFTAGQWKSIGETVLALDSTWELPVEFSRRSRYELQPISRWRAEAVAGLFLRQKEAFYPHWGTFAKQACKLYSCSRSNKAQAYFSQLIEIFFSELDRISDEELVACYAVLPLNSKHINEPTVSCRLRLLAKEPLTQALEMQLAARVIQGIMFEGRSHRELEGILGFQISNYALKQGLDNAIPFDSQGDTLDARIRVLEVLNQCRGGFQYELAVHRASLEAWNARCATPDEPNRCYYH